MLGWRFEVGATRPCRVMDGKILIESFPGNLEFKTPLPYNCIWQKNVFEGEGICFVLVLEDQERVCIGQTDGRIILLTYDGILAGISSWEVPLRGMNYSHMGYYRDSSCTYGTYASPLDPYWVHTSRRSMRLEKPVSFDMLHGDYNDSDYGAEALSAIIRQQSILASELGNGWLDAGSGQWYIDPSASEETRFVLGEDV